VKKIVILKGKNKLLSGLRFAATEKWTEKLNFDSFSDPMPDANSSCTKNPFSQI
jgi:hypothetical protein